MKVSSSPNAVVKYNTGFVTKQRQIYRINQLAKRLKARELECQGIETSYLKSTTISLSDLGLRNGNDLGNLEEALSVLVKATKVKAGLLDTKGYLDHLSKTYVELKVALTKEERASLITEKANQFIEEPLMRKLVKRNSAMLSILSCETVVEVAQKTVAILQQYFNGAHPTFVIARQDKEGQQVLVPLDIAFPPKLKGLVQDSVIHKKLGEFSIPIDATDNFYAAKFVELGEGEIYREENVSRGKLIERASDFLDTEMKLIEAIAGMILLPQTNTYIMVPLIARGRKLGIATFLKKGERLSNDEQQDIENFLKLVSYKISFMQIEQELEELVAAKTVEMERIERENARLEIAAGMAHHGGNSLVTIRGNLEFLLEDARENKQELDLAAKKVDEIGQTGASIAVIIDRLVERNSGSITRIQRSLKEAEELSTVTESCLEFSRQIKLNKRPLKLESVIDSIIQESTFVAEVKIVKEFDENLPEIDLDPRYFGILMKEIIKNAKDEFEEIEGAKTIRFYLRQTLQGIELAVWNSGSRLPKKNPAKIFKPFVSRKNTAGLGLANVRNIVVEHGWSINVREEIVAEEVGVAFIVKIPKNKKGDK